MLPSSSKETFNESRTSPSQSFQLGHRTKKWPFLLVTEGWEWAKVTSLSATEYVTVASVMTAGIMVGIWLVPVVGKKLISGMINLEKRDKKWGEIFSASMFLGMISAFLGYVFCNFAGVFRGELSGLIPPLVMLVSALMMGLCALALKKLGWRWMNDYALPISLIAGMASAIPITAWLG